MFEFYYQSGEFTSEQSNILKDFILPFLGVAIPLLVYYLGQRYDRQKEANKQAQFEFDKLRYLNHLIKGAVAFNKDLIQTCKVLVDEINANPSSAGILSMISYDDLLRIVEKINQEDFYHSYVKNIPNDNIGYIFTYMDTINRIRADIEELWINKNEIAKLRKKEIAECIEKTIDEINSLKIHHSEHEELLLDIFQIQTNFENSSLSNSNSYVNLVDEYFRPLVATISNKVPKDFPYLSNLYRQSLDGSILCLRLINSNKGLSHEISLMINTLQQIQEKLESKRQSLSDHINRGLIY